MGAARTARSLFTRWTSALRVARAQLPAAWQVGDEPNEAGVRLRAARRSRRGARAVSRSTRAYGGRGGAPPQATSRDRLSATCRSLRRLWAWSLPSAIVLGSGALTRPGQASIPVPGLAKDGRRRYLAGSHAIAPIRCAYIAWPLGRNSRWERRVVHRIPFGLVDGHRRLCSKSIGVIQIVKLDAAVQLAGLWVPRTRSAPDSGCTQAPSGAYRPRFMGGDTLVVKPGAVALQRPIQAGVPQCEQYSSHLHAAGVEEELHDGKCSVGLLSLAECCSSGR
jgi:hypothetical protein